MKFMIVTDHTAYSQSNYEIFNEVNRLNTNCSIVPFNVTNKCMNLNAPILNVSEISPFSDGVLIATTIEQAGEILSAVNNSRKVLYLYDLDWMFNVINYEYLYEILNHPKLEMFVRSPLHADAVLEITNRLITIMPRFNLEEIWNSQKETVTQ